MAEKTRTLLGGGLVLLGLVSIAVGVYSGESFIVLQKAIRICLECIGIG